MNELYRILGLTKQAVHSMIKRSNTANDEQMQMLGLVMDIRKEHPGMGLRDIYFMLQPQHIGRDAFEVWCKRWQLQVRKKRNPYRTTDSNGVTRFDNLIEGKVLTKINQVWQSDITYFQCGKQCFYLTFIVDAFSRRIVGYHVSKRLLTEHTTLPALKMALRLRKQHAFDNLIFHSDGGGQYYDQHFLALTKKHGIRNSMCEYAWQNGKAERINGVIKNNYLLYRDITSFESLVAHVDQAVTAYNTTKPHTRLHRMSPITFEQNLLHLPAVNSGKLQPTRRPAEVYHN